MACLDENMVEAFVRGRLAAEAKARVEVHVDECPTCSQLVALVGQSSFVQSVADVSAPLADDAAPPRRGAGFGRYVILDELGAGGMGNVYAAYDPELDRKVALKLIRPDRGAGELTVADARARLSREAQAMARLSHPNIITVHDVSTVGGQLFLTMELLPGDTLEKWLAKAPRTPRQIVDVFIAAGRGLAAAHAAGLTHRDFKPSNVLVGKDGRVKVLDFGLAKSQAAPEAPARALDAACDGAVEITRTGMMIGTPAYMAPEQFACRATDARADQFSFCVALYESLYGERPFAGRTLDEIATNVMTGNLREPPRKARVPSRWRRAIARGLSVAPEARHPSMEALLESLARASRLRSPALGVALLVLLSAVGYRYFVVHQERLAHGGERAVARVWNPARQALVRDAFLATGKPYAADAWSGVARALDAYSRAWSAMWTDAYEATHVRGVQSDELLDLRMQCLERRLQDLDALTTVLAGGGAEVAQRAVDAALALPTLDACADGKALRARVRPPEDAGKRARVAASQAALAQVRALRNAGKLGDAIARLRPLADESRALGYRPLEAELNDVLGELERQSGKYDDAERALRRAVQAGEAGADNERVVKALTHLADVLGERARNKDAHDAAELAGAVIERMGGSGLLQAELDYTTAVLLEHEGRYADSSAQGARALAYFDERFGPDHPRSASPLYLLASNETTEGKFKEALRLGRRALAIKEKELGASHPDVAFYLAPVAGALVGQGDLDGALALDERALGLRERALGDDNRLVADSLRRIGDILMLRKHFADAEAHFARALAINEKHLGPDHPEVAFTLRQVASAHDERGERARAEAEERRALAILEKVLGPDHHTVGKTLVELAHIELGEGKVEDALAANARAIAVLEKSVGHDHPDLVPALVSAGDAYLRLDKPAQALAALERAHKLLLAGEGGSREDRAEIERLLERARAGKRGGG